MPHLLITGAPGIGKTTLLRTVAGRLAGSGVAVVGFYTAEVRERGVRRGFELVTLDGRRLILADVGVRGPHRVGRYGVDVEGFERLLAALDLPRSPAGLVVLDEIGKMECLSARFTADVIELLDSGKTVVATIALKGDGFIRRTKERPDCRLVIVTHENRDELVERLTSEIHGLLGAAGRQGASTPGTGSPR